MSGRRSGRGGRDRGNDNDQEDGNSGARSKSRAKSLPTLRDDNYEAWLVCLKDKAYAAGKEWEKIVKQSEEEADDDPSPVDDDSVARREMWEIITDSLPPAMRARHVGVQLGAVEALLRGLQTSYARVSSGARWGWQSQLQDQQLGDRNIEDYFAAAERIFDNLQLQGDKVDDSRKVFAVLRGLPHDYEQAKSSLEMAEQGGKSAASSARTASAGTATSASSSTKSLQGVQSAVTAESRRKALVAVKSGRATSAAS